MASGVCNIARGRARTYFELPGAGSSIQVVLFKTIVGDTLLRDYDDLAAVKAANNEADFTNYTRKTITSGVSVTVDDTGDQLTVSIPNQTWTSAGGATNNNIVKLLVCYKPGASSADNLIVPITYHDYITTTDGTNRTVNISASGLYRSS